MYEPSRRRCVCYYSASRGGMSSTKLYLPHSLVEGGKGGESIIRRSPKY